MILVGNKVDLMPRTVKSEKPFEWALKNKMSYCETSAKTGAGFDNIMNEIVSAIDVLNKSRSQETADSN